MGWTDFFSIQCEKSDEKNFLEESGLYEADISSAKALYFKKEKEVENLHVNTCYIFIYVIIIISIVRALLEIGGMAIVPAWLADQ